MVGWRANKKVQGKVQVGERSLIWSRSTITVMATFKTSRADFESVWPSLVADLQEAAKKYNVPPNALEWFTKVWQQMSVKAPVLTAIVARGQHAGW